MNHLDKRLRFSSRLLFGHIVRRCPITCQCLLQNRNEGAIPREKYGMFILIELMTSIGNIKPRKCLSRPRNSCDKTDRLFVACLAFIYDLIDRCRRHSQIFCPRIAARYITNRMRAVECLCRLNDGRCRRIARIQPRIHG